MQSPDIKVETFFNKGTPEKPLDIISTSELTVGQRKPLRWNRYDEGDVVFEWKGVPIEPNLPDFIISEIPRLIGLRVLDYTVDVDGSVFIVEAYLEDGQHIAFVDSPTLKQMSVSTRLVTVPLVQWIVQHNVDPSGMEDVSHIAEEINKTLA